MRYQTLTVIFFIALSLMTVGCQVDESSQEDQQVSVVPMREVEGASAEEYMTNAQNPEGQEGVCGGVNEACCEQVYCDEERCELLFSCSSDYNACRIFTRAGGHTSVCFDVRDCGDLGNHCCVNKECAEGECVRGTCV